MTPIHQGLWGQEGLGPALIPDSERYASLDLPSKQEIFCHLAQQGGGVVSFIHGDSGNKPHHQLT